MIRIGPTCAPWLAAPLLLCSLLLGCAKQAQGERCDTANDNQDCESGLVCKSLRSLNRGTSGAVCCPNSGSSSVAICRQGSLDFSDDESSEPASEPEQMTPEDGAPTPDAGQQATEQAATDDGTEPDGDTQASPADAGSVDAGDAG